MGGAWKGSRRSSRGGVESLFPIAPRARTNFAGLPAYFLSGLSAANLQPLTWSRIWQRGPLALGFTSLGSKRQGYRVSTSEIAFRTSAVFLMLG